MNMEEYFEMLRKMSERQKQSHKTEPETPKNEDGGIKNNFFSH